MAISFFTHHEESENGKASHWFCYRKSRGYEEPSGKPKALDGGGSWRHVKGVKASRKNTRVKPLDHYTIAVKKHQESLDPTAKTIKNNDKLLRKNLLADQWQGGARMAVQSAGRTGVGGGFVGVGLHFRGKNQEFSKNASPMLTSS